MARFHTVSPWFLQRARLRCLTVSSLHFRNKEPASIMGEVKARLAFRQVSEGSQASQPLARLPGLRDPDVPCPGPRI